MGPNSDYESKLGNHPAAYEGDANPNMPMNNLIRKGPTNTPRREPNRAIIHTLGKLLEMSKGIRKITVICARTHGRHLQVDKASNFRDGSFKVMY
jgi:hypothetical protein